MKTITNSSAALLLSAAMALPLASGAQAQELAPADTVEGQTITVEGTVPADLSGLVEGPEIEGFISARNRSAVQVTGEEGATDVVSLSEATRIRGKGGFLGLGSSDLDASELYNGVPVTIDTVQWEGGLIASRIELKKDDLETAAMIHNGTAQRFGEHEVAINQNAAATEALRGRVGDIDQYNIKATTNAYFDTGKWNLSSEAQRDLCSTVRQAESMDNALLLVVGYTDSVGDRDYNQTLSERRAGRVVNHLQQECGWAPYRMLTPTGMSEADPLADNTTAEGRAQNRRVAVNILVSKAVEGL